MEMQQIRYFLAVARTLNFTRAAEECHVSQPALTRAIQALEAELGGALLLRERRTSHLTELGKRMQPLLQRCFDSALSAKELARAVTSNALAPVSLMVSHTVNLELVMGPVSALFQSFPGLQLKILHGGAAEILEALRNGGADLALAGPIEDEWERLDRWTLLEEGFVLALRADHPLARAAAVDPAMLCGAALLSQQGCECRGAIEAWLSSCDAAPAIAHEVVTHADLNALLEAGLGFAIVSESAPRGPQIAHRPLAGLAVRRMVSAYAVAGRPRGPAAVGLLNLLRANGLRAIA